MYHVSYTNRFKKDLKQCAKRGLNLTKIMSVIKQLEQNGCLSEEFKPHKLSGIRAGQWECHIQPDWLLVWEQNDEKLTLLFLQTGTHSDLFK